MEQAKYEAILEFTNEKQLEIEVNKLESQKML